MNLILPVAGKSNRFPNLRPKWMLSHPNGNMMIVEAILPIAKPSDDIYLIYLKEHQDKYSFKGGLERNLAEYNLKINFIELSEPTPNQVQTVREGLKKIGGDFSFLIKDCDNQFYFDLGDLDGQEGENFVCYVDLEKVNNSDPSSKSYVVVDEFGYVSNIAEKKIISNKFCCGAYHFKSSEAFLNIKPRTEPNWYISDIIFILSLEGASFKAVQCSGYEDWGTLEQWNKYKKQFKTLFCDLDGTIFKNSSHLFPPYIENAEPIVENVEFIKKNKFEIIFTTARPRQYESITKKQLKECGLEGCYKALIMGLNHSERVIVNDFSDSNPYPSCSAINIPRNCNNLKKYFL